MTNFMCATCGTQYPDSRNPPESCPICEDERQYIGYGGQQWTTLAELQQDHHNELREVEPHLTGIGTVPNFSIAQRALLVQTPGGNILWDCIPLMDDATIEAVQALGGLDAIAISHPHYYSSTVEWAHAFGATIYLHTADRQHVQRPDPAITYWEGETFSPLPGITLINTGGHFEGATVLHWPSGAEGRGVLLTGDILHVVQDRRWVTFMYSYPNMIPLPASIVRSMVAAVEPYAFDRIYGAWWEKVVAVDAKDAVRRSADRYIAAITDRAR
jgi:glyoxylase-like metal-dependent hydrolase (beta-lactamase superfamily II)